MATPTPARVIQMIRSLLRDNPDYNILLDDLQFTEEEVEIALELTASAYNVMPPATSLEWTNLPPILAVLGAIRFLNFSEANLQARNQVTLPTDRQEAMGVDDKFTLYLQLQRESRAEWEDKARKYKNSVNAESFYSEILSDYSYIGRNW